MLTIIRVISHDGGVIGPVEMPGRLLVMPLPPPLVARTREEAGSHHVEIDLSAALTVVGEVFCGRLTVRLQDASSRRIETVNFPIPPPAPWAVEHLRPLYDGAGALDMLAESLPNSGGAPWRQTVRSLSDQFNPAVLEDLRQAAITWLRAQMRDDASALLEQAFGKAGGRERPAETYRRLGRTIRLLHHEPIPIPERTVRQVAARAPTYSSSTAALLLAVLRSADQLARADGTVGEIEEWVTRPIRRAAASLQAPIPLREPPMSSWPSELLALRTAARRCVSALGVSGPSGEDWVPLSPLWKLYEMWVAWSVADTLRLMLGQPKAYRDGQELVWTWTSEEQRVCLHYQRRLHRATSPLPNGIAGGHTHDLLSVTSTLIPDLLLGVTQRTVFRSLVYDSKHTASLFPDEAAPEGSKYLWGIRHATSSTALPGIAGVVLVTPAAQAIDFKEEALIVCRASAPPPSRPPLNQQLTASDLGADLVRLGLSWQAWKTARGPTLVSATAASDLRVQ